MTLKDELFRDVLECFMHGSYEEWQAAERRYLRFINRGKRSKK